MVISKSAQKVLNKADKPTAMKLNKALNNIQNNAGHIEPLKQRWSIIALFSKEPQKS